MARLAYIFLALFVAAVAGQTSDDPVPTTQEGPGQPSTTTPVPPTTAPLPDEPEKGSWNISDGDRTCIMAQMGIRLNFTYVTSANKTEMMSYDIPSAANETNTTGSSCGGGGKKTTDEKLVINFKNFQFSFEMIFQYDNASNDWYARDVVVTYLFGKTYFPGSGVDDKTMTSGIYNNTNVYKTNNGSSFQCVTESTNSKFSLPDDGPIDVSVTTASLRIQAFRMGPAGDFDTPIPCPADTEVSNIVPIAVGAALAGLVVIVLVAYLIGRKKNQRGYESV